MAETFEVVITPKAAKSLEKILTYHTINSSHQTAKRIRDGLLDEIAKLSRHPESNGIVKELSDQELIFRRRIKRPYRIIFNVLEKERMVFVV